jgi:SulP family sulfate permease
MHSNDHPFAPKLISILREGYRLDALRRDALAGLTVAIVALPLSMAIAIASGAPPERGLYTAIIGGFLVSALGGSRFQIGGPAGAFIVLIAAIIERHGFEGLLLATWIAGFLMLALGFLRLGTLIKFIPQPVIVGFTAGIAVIIFASQIRDLFGLSLAGKEPSALLPKLGVLLDALPTINLASAGLAAASIVLIVLIRRHRPDWPGLLIAVILGALAAKLFGLPVETIGSRFGGVPSALPYPEIPALSPEKIRAVLPDAIAIALLGSIESLLSAVVADGISGRRHRSNTELVAQGFANVGVALFGGICATGTIARTATNIRAGAHGPVAGMLHAIYLLAFVMLAAPLLALIPLASLAGILAVVAWNMAERHAVVSILRGERGEAFVFGATFLLTVFRDLTEGILVGVVLGAILFAARMARLVEMSQAMPGPDGSAFKSPEESPLTLDASGDILVYRVSGPLFFGSTPRFGDMIARLGLRPRAVMLDLSSVPFVDTSGVQGIAMLERAARQSGARLYIAGARREVIGALIAGDLGLGRVKFARSIASARARLEKA